MGYTTSPLRYPGGKTRLSNFIKVVFEENNLVNGEYIEPFAGGAGIAWSLLFHNHVSKVHINDLSLSIYAFWKSVFEETEDLCRLIIDTSVNVENWEIQKLIQQKPTQCSNLELGFSTFFLNRTNRSGIILGGIIGGKEQEGEWKLDARYNKKNLIKRIQKIANYKDCVNLYNQDAADFLINIIPSAGGRSLIYLDPPYFQKGPNLYENHYRKEDHNNLARLLETQVKNKWLITYDNVSEVRDLYRDYRSITYKLSYSAANRYKGSEIMIFSPGLEIPNVENPLSVKISKKKSK